MNSTVAHALQRASGAVGHGAAGDQRSSGNQLVTSMLSRMCATNHNSTLLQRGQVSTVTIYFPGITHGGRGHDERRNDAILRSTRTSYSAVADVFAFNLEMPPFGGSFCRLVHIYTLTLGHAVKYEASDRLHLLLI